MKRLLLILIALVLAATAAAAWIVLGPGPLSFAGGNTVALASYSVNQGGADPTGVPAGLKNADLIARGEYLTRAADCEACHTTKDGAPFAGGLALNLPFGTLYSPNITPDKETGIGNWSDADFLQALHKGIAPDGTRLYPAFPYAAYTMITDADALAIKAYLFSLKPVHAAIPASTLKFPYNQRWLMTFWSAFFNPDTRFQPNPDKSPEWNRGAYLAEALTHCGECHTPRNLMQALDNRKKFAGAVAAGWKAYNITQDKDSGIGGWSDETLTRFLGLGHAEGYGTAAGPMGEAVDKSLMHLAPEDIKALTIYLRSIPAATDPDLPAPKLAPPPAAVMASAADAHAAALFSGACAGCHGWTGNSQVLSYASFTGARSVNDPSARNVAQAIVWGVNRQTPSGPVNMPAFGNSYSDAEIAVLANYVTARFGAAASQIRAADVARIRREVSQ